MQAVGIKIFADGADLDSMVAMASDERVCGFTTNPTLMSRAGVTDYEAFARRALEKLPGLPVCFEVFSDELKDMRRQALLIDSWGDNVFVKIPISTTDGTTTAGLVRGLAAEGLSINVTAIASVAQVAAAANAMAEARTGIVSVFAGRIADTGRDPVPVMKEAVEIVSAHPQQELLWASPREVLNIRQADAIGCDIITVTHDLLRKLDGFGRDLEEVSLDTVRMFRRDAMRSGFSL